MKSVSSMLCVWLYIAVDEMDKTTAEKVEESENVISPRTGMY